MAHSAKPQGEVSELGGSKIRVVVAGLEDGAPRHHPSMMLQMLYPSNDTLGVTCRHMAPFSFTPLEHKRKDAHMHTCWGPAALIRMHKQALMSNN